MINLTQIVGFDWNEANLSHIEKHTVAAKECEEGFFNKPLTITEDSAHSQAERRYRAYGQTNSARVLVMIFTIRDGKIRIISARNQSKKERQDYNQLTKHL